jgi:hypothetical protein
VAKRLEFMGLVMDGEALHTPEGSWPLADVTRAEFVRETEVDGHKPDTEETSMPAVAGGAAAGGALFGAAGAVVGGVLGSGVKEEEPGRPNVRTVSAKLVFETEGGEGYSRDIPREQEVDAISFAKKVDKAAMRARR